MQKFKGSKGPWFIKGESEGNYISIANRHKQVCKVNWGDNDFENAKLISSAPQMLEALQEVLSSIEVLPEIKPSTVIKIKNVIEKATKG